MAQRLKTGLAIFGLSVLTIISVELLARAAVFVDDSFFDQKVTVFDQTVEDYVPKAHLPAYEDAEFDPVTLFAELHQTLGRLGDKSGARIAYQPYTVWSRRPFQGNLINVDDEGNRMTSYNSDAENALEVWALGGSTMWGHGAPDDQTIPSYLAKLLKEWGVDTRVTNLGESGFVSTQEVINAIRGLQVGRRPHIVLFYDGVVNDSLSAALWSEVPGTHQNLTHIRNKLENQQNEAQETAIASLVRLTGLFRVSQFVLKRIGKDSAQRNSSIEVVTDREQGVPQAAQQAANIWLENYNIMAALGQRFGFVPIFVFQPALGVGEKPLDPSEEDILSIAMKGARKGGSTRVNRQLRTLIREHLRDEDTSKAIYDISDIFSDLAEPVYIDLFHISGKGNQLVAEGIFHILKNELCSQVPARANDITGKQLKSACIRTLLAADVVE